MSILNKYNPGLAVLVAAMLGASIIGCGGGASTTPDPVDTSSPVETGIAGIENLGSTISIGLPQTGIDAESVPGASSEAPLGLNTDYTPLIAGSETTRELSRSSSALQPGDDMEIRNGTISAFGVEPDYSAGNLVFTEGEIVTIWLEYELSAQPPSVKLSWNCAETGLDYRSPYIANEGAGIYTTKLTTILPVGSAGEANLRIALDYGKNTSVVIGPNVGDPEILDIPFTIEAGPVYEEFTYDPPTETLEGDWPKCVPHIAVAWSEDNLSVTATCDKILSNVVLVFEDRTEEKFEDIPGYVGTFSGTGNNTGKRLIGAFVHSGCNTDFWNEITPSKGEFFSNSITGHSMMVWEDLIQSADYDYNDFVSSMKPVEYRKENGDLIQVDMVIKALARGAGYDHDWQLNVDSAFNNTFCVAVIDQYYADGRRHGNQRIWYSSAGVSLPVFISSKQALPPPAGYWATNAFDIQPVVDGDYAVVRILFDNPVQQGEYTDMPYEPELRVKPTGGNIYTVPLWTKPGDYVDPNGRPLAFIVPGMYAWPVEGVKIWDVYSHFNEWTEWTNGTAPEPNAKFYDYAPVGNHFDASYLLINTTESISY